MYRLSHFIKEGQLNQPLLELIGKSLYYSTGLSVTLLDRQGSKLSHLGTHFNHEDLFPDAMNHYNAFIKEQLSLPGIGIHVYDSDYDFSFLSVLLVENGKYYGSLLIGPYISRAISEHSINEILGLKGFPMAQRDMVKSLYDGLPILTATRNYFMQQLILLVMTNERSADMYPDGHMKELTADTVTSIKAPAELEKTEHNYALEILFLTKVKNGDLEKVVDLYNEHIKTQYLNFSSSNPLRGAKNKALSFSTLLARTIIDGGVENEKALALEDYYKKRLETTRDMSQLISVIETMIVQYTNTILQLSNINHVSVIKNASKYVHLHLSEPIRLNDVANYVNLSPNYFSSLFKREMNLSFADYVNQTRIKESQYLLETTDYSILDIAISVGYNNQNYFTTIFRKFTSITPKQYRMRSAK